MTEDKLINHPAKNDCWEKTGRISHLITAAEEVTQYLGDNSVGYYYWAMLETLKSLNNEGINYANTRKGGE